ncbi:MAG: T9SS type A sorting domain-containing protein [Bacteroidota bacterium]
MKTFFTFIFLGVVFYGFSQLITISETYQIPQIGDSVHYKDANTFGFDAAGVGTVTAKVWDFAALMDAGTELDYLFVDPTATGGANTNFPTATLAREISNESGYFFYSTTANTYDRHGWYAGATNYGIYNNPATEFQFPITAGNSYNKTYHGIFAPSGSGEDSAIIDMGQIIVNADMQGTLILPTGTFNNVLRLHLVESFHIKYYFMGTPIVDALLEDDYYYWFQDTIFHPVLIYGTTDQDGSQISEVLRYQPIDVSTGISKFEINQGFVFPNPTNGIIYVNIQNFEKVVLFDISGNELNSYTSKIIDLSEYPDGIYFAKAAGLNDCKVFKIILEK